MSAHGVGHSLGSLVRWVARKPDVPPGMVGVGYARGALAIPVAMAVVSVIEIVAFHLLVPWPVVRWILDVLGLITLVALLCWMAGKVVRPHLLSAEELVIRTGPFVCLRIPLSQIERARRDRRMEPTEMELVRSGESAHLALPGPDGTTVTLTLAQPLPARLPGRRSLATPVREVRLSVDDPDELLRLLADPALTCKEAPTTSKAA